MVDTTKLEIGSAERVALELMHTINSFNEPGNPDRAYWLTLYSQCLRVVYRGDPQKALAS